MAAALVRLVTQTNYGKLPQISIGFRSPTLKLKARSPPTVMSVAFFPPLLEQQQMWVLDVLRREKVKAVRNLPSRSGKQRANRQPCGGTPWALGQTQPNSMYRGLMRTSGCAQGFGMRRGVSDRSRGNRSTPLIHWTSSPRARCDGPRLS